MKNLILLWSLVLITGMSSCKKNLLDSTPQDKYSDAAVWKDSTLVNAYVNQIYADVPSQYDGSTFVTDLLSNYTDESTNISATAISSGFDQNQWNSSTFSLARTLYAQSYVDIRLCNVFMDKIGTLNASAALKNRLTGEVRFLRALYYHYLYNYFGRFPIIKTTLQLNDNLYVPRNTDAECIDFITAEFKAAADLLPLRYTGNNVGRATKGAADAFLCRTYLYAGQWQNAADAAKLVMGLGTYSLFADYQGIFYPQNDNNSEVIFDRQYIAAQSTLQYSNIDFYDTPATYTGKNTGNVNPSENLVSLYQMKDGSTFDWNNPVMAANPYVNRDPRMDATIMHDGTIWLGKTVDMKAGSVFNPLTRPSRTGYYLKKFLNPAYDHTSVTDYSGQNFILIRYAEVLLDYAEAQFKLGNTEEARKYVNMIRARPSVNMPGIPAGSFTWDSYINEREIELAFEGLRLFDINRWKTGPQTRGSDLYGVSVTANPQNIRTYQKVVSLRSGVERIFLDKMYLFPIPLSEIQKYPNNSLTQNPGWEQ
jgi:hypothetical protein